MKQCYILICDWVISGYVSGTVQHINMLLDDKSLLIHLYGHLAQSLSRENKIVRDDVLLINFVSGSIKK